MNVNEINAFLSETAKFKVANDVFFEINGDPYRKHGKIASVSINGYGNIIYGIDGDGDGVCYNVCDVDVYADSEPIADYIRDYSKYREGDVVSGRKVCRIAADKDGTIYLIDNYNRII